MKLTLVPALVALFVLTSEANAQLALDPTTLRLRSKTRTIQVSLDDRSATLIQGGARVRIELEPKRLNAIHLAARAVSWTPQRRDLSLSVWDKTVGLIYLDPHASDVQPLVRALRSLTARFAERPKPSVVSIEEQDEAEPGYAVRELRVRRRGGARLIYRLGDRRWVLPRPRLTAPERARIRSGVRILEGKEPLPQGASRADVPAGATPWVSVHAEQRGWSAHFGGITVDRLAPRARALGGALKRALDRAFRFRERTLFGTVTRKGRIRCGRLEVEVQGPLRSLTRALRGRRVRLRALVRDDGRWAVALFLFAHDDQGGVHAVQGSGSATKTFRTPPWTVSVDLPAGTRRLPRERRDVPVAGLSLEWADPRGATPGGCAKGAAGRLGG